MPTYEYECASEDHHRFELFQRFAEPPVQECPECGATVRRIIFAPGVIFKGSGFYKTDNAVKPAATSESAGEASSDASSDSAAAENGSASDAKAKPVAETGTKTLPDKPKLPERRGGSERSSARQE
ncbi:MAG: zinc ribbon domain-containing protein [Chloroflexia bacterium]